MIPERYTDPAVALRAWRASTGYTCREAGAVFGVSRDAVRQWEHGICRVPKRVQAQLRREGWLVGAKSWMRWSPEEITWILDHVGQWPLAEVARRLSAHYGVPRTPSACEHILSHHRRPPTPTTLLTRKQIARLCGVAPQAVQRWVGRGWLVLPEWSLRGVRGHWAVPPAALTAFITTHAVQLDPAAMPPSPYQMHALACWRAARWLTMDQATLMAGRGRSTLRRAIYRGDLPAVRKLRAHQAWWMIRARDLAAFLRQREAA